MPSTLIPPSSAAATTFPKIRNRHKNSPPPRKRLKERARQAQEDAREFSRLQSATYNATGEARKAAQKAFDDYLEREAHKYDTSRVKERQTRKQSRGLRMRL